MKLQVMRSIAKESDWAEYQYIPANKLIGFRKAIARQNSWFKRLFGAPTYSSYTVKLILYYTTGTCRVVVHGKGILFDEIFRELSNDRISELLTDPLSVL